MDWTVVKVVANERTEGAGDEKVLSRPPSVLAAVALVPTPEGAASDMIVSAFVARVGALDFGWISPSWEAETECLLWDSELCRDRWDEMGVERETWGGWEGSGRDERG